MSPMSRVTVTLPAEIVEEIDRIEKNRSRFVLEGVRRELERRRRESLRRSLESPHAETAEHVADDFAAWAEDLPDDEADDLVEKDEGTAVRWVPGRGWVEGPK